MGARVEACRFCARKMTRVSKTRKTYACKNPKCSGGKK